MKSLATPIAVDIGRVEERDTLLDGRLEHAERVPLRRHPVTPQLPGAQSNT